MSTTDITVEILKEIRDATVQTSSRLDETNSRLDETNRKLDETNSRLDETNLRIDRGLSSLIDRNDATNFRIDRLTEAVVRGMSDLAGRIDGTNERIDGVITQLGRMVARDHRLEDSVSDLQRRVEVLETKVG